MPEKPYSAEELLFRYERAVRPFTLPLLLGHWRNGGRSFRLTGPSQALIPAEALLNGTSLSAQQNLSLRHQLFAAHARSGRVSQFPSVDGFFHQCSSGSPSFAADS